MSDFVGRAVELERLTGLLADSDACARAGRTHDVSTAVGDIDRGRGGLALQRVTDSYTGWRGRAIEPVVRDALERLLPDTCWPEVRAVGGWWPRTNVPEIDLVGANARPPTATPSSGPSSGAPTARSAAPT